MLSSSVRTLITKSPTAYSSHVRLLTTTPNRTFHATARREQADVEAAAASSTTGSTVIESSPLLNRFIVTMEATISKIFPAGFGWQTASILAGSWGYASDSLDFALATGSGDAVGVLAGHVTYYGAKKAITGYDINMTKELHTGILLGSAAFCSGTAWQPIVNALQSANLPFSQVFMGTWIGCALAFYGGLRVGRTVLSGPLKYVEEPTYDNSKTDIALSTAIGGATGFFVGTDAAYMPEQNFLIKIVGITDGTTDLVGCAIAGSSTSLGFMSAQSALNFVYPKGRCWND